MPSSSKRILKIGVTGGIGSGKTTVCAIFGRLGVPVLYADDISKELSNNDPVIRKKLKALLGDSAYMDGGLLNRSFVASKIFSIKSLQRKVEAVIHPRVDRERQYRIDRLRKEGNRIIIIESALLYEAGLNKKLDAVVVVDADKTERINRVRKRDVISEDTVRGRIFAQLDVKKKLEKADYVIFNDGTLEELESKVRFLYTIFEQITNEDKRA